MSRAEELEGRFAAVVDGVFGDVPLHGDVVIELIADDVVLVTGDETRRVLPLGALVGVTWEGGALTLDFPDGAVVLRGEPRLAAAGRAIVARACAPGELTLALRALGSHRRVAGADELHRRYFEPLLAARKKLARTVEPRAQTMALDARALRAAYEDFARGVAARSGGLAPADRRALEAQLDEAIDPLLAALHGLELAASVLRTSAADRNVAAWRQWSREAAAVFAAADRCWPAVARLLAGWHPGPKPSLWRRMTGRAR